MGHSGLNQEQVVAMPCNLEGELCQPVVWMTTAAMMPFRLLLPKDDDFRLFFHVERRETLTKSNRSVAQRVLNVEVEADHHRRYHVWETPVRCTATAVALRVAARQRGTCFEASYQRQNKLTKQHTKQTAADDL
eukprot:1608679-Pleurochrysis_carterae.AAC.2